MRTRISRAAIPLAAAGIALAGLAAPAPSDRAPLDWYALDRTVIDRLLREDLDGVLESLTAPAKADAVDLLRELNVRVRAGLRESAAATIDRFSGVTDLPGTSVLSGAADFLIDRHEWDLAQRFLERIPRAQPGWGYVLVRRWTAAGHDPGEIDRWLAARAEINPRYWFTERLRFRSDQGTVGPLLDALAAEVRAAPASLETALRFVEAAKHGGPGVDHDWMGRICKPRLAYESYRLGDELRVRAPTAAIALLERSMVTDYTEEDQKRLDRDLRTRSALWIAEEDWEPHLRANTRLGLIDAYRRADRPGDAQAALEALGEIDPDAIVPLGLGQLAGQVQRDSGARVFENRVRAAEAENRDSSEYWRTRARYFAGRREHVEAVAAFERALALTPIDAEDPDFDSFERAGLLRDWAEYLRKRSGRPEALGLLRAELGRAPLGGEYARRIVGHLLGLEDDRSGFLRADDERLWMFLAAQVRWVHREERLLWRMIGNAPPTERDRGWSRAEKLAKGADPSRSRTLGWIMTRSVESSRAIPLLRDAVARLPQGADLDGARMTLFGAYLDVGNWRSAEAIWPAARERLTPREIAERLGSLALVAGRAGDRDDALRLWAEKANLDRGDLRGLAELAAFDLRESLVAFYGELAREQPACWVPRVALERLGTPGD